MSKETENEALCEQSGIYESSKIIGNEVLCLSSEDDMLSEGEIICRHL